jgi:predicted metal-dependent phosphoesterase TrpH
MGLADLHIHTTYSWDGTCDVKAVLKRAAEVGLDVIAITDHDEIRGGLEAQDFAPAYGVDVIVGSEVSTADGHLLALFIRNDIPKGLSLEETLRRVADQGGCAIAAHPAARGVNSLTPQTIGRALAQPDLASVLVGVEVSNAGLLHTRSNHTAQRLANSLPVAQVGSSDAHMFWMIGKGATRFPGKSAPGLRRALETRQTQPVISPSFPRLNLLTAWLMRYALRAAGWVIGNPAPDRPLAWVRL